MTRPIPVIEGETDYTDVLPRVETCGWCAIRIGADGLPPVRTHGKAFHPGCIGAYALEHWHRDIQHRRIFR